MARKSPRRAQQRAVEVFQGRPCRSHGAPAWVFQKHADLPCPECWPLVTYLLPNPDGGWLQLFKTRTLCDIKDGERVLMEWEPLVWVLLPPPRKRSK